MTVYVEFVLVDNIVVDLLILLLTKSFLKLNTKKIFLFLSTMFGTLFALLSPLLPNLINIIIKLPIALCMIIIAFRPKKIKELFAETITFFVATFSMIGCCVAICEIFKISFVVKNGMILEYKFPIGCVLLICFVVFVCSKNIFCLIFKRQKNLELSYSIILKNKNKKIKTLAFLDTGNKLSYNQKPITVIGYKTFFELFPNVDITNFLLGKTLNLKNANHIYIESVGEKKQTLVFEIDEIVINNTIKKDMPIIISNVNFIKKTNCDVVISNEILS